ncbi:MAG: hypothetical protein AAFR21_02465 [Pseudomonadota bacterium]
MTSSHGNDNVSVTEAALKKLMEQTIDELGPIDPATLPHRLKDRLRAQVSAETDLDEAIAAMMKEIEATKK